MINKIQVIEEFMDMVMLEYLKLNPLIGNAKTLHNIMSNLLKKEEFKMINAFLSPKNKYG